MTERPQPPIRDSHNDGYERRLPPALEARATVMHQTEVMLVNDILDWLYGEEGEWPITTDGALRRGRTPGLVERVQRRAAALFAAWKDQGIEDVSLAWGLALRAELGEEP